MPSPRATAYAARLLSSAALGTFGSASVRHSPPVPFLGLFCWILFLSGFVKPFPSLGGWLAMAWLRGISCPPLACLHPIPLHHLLSHSEQLMALSGSARGGRGDQWLTLVLVLSMNVVKPWPIPKPRRLHVCAGGNDSPVTHGRPARAGRVPRGEPPCQDRSRGRVRG